MQLKVYCPRSYQQTLVQRIKAYVVYILMGDLHVLLLDEGPSERSSFIKLLQAFMSGYSTGVK